MCRKTLSTGGYRSAYVDRFRMVLEKSDWRNRVEEIGEMTVA